MTLVSCTTQLLQVNGLYNNHRGNQTLVSTPRVSNVQIQSIQNYEISQKNASTDISNYLTLLRQCSRSKSLNDAKLLHKKIIDEGYEQNRLLVNTLIHVYGKCGALVLAQDAFLNLYDKNVYTWTMMLGACVECGSFNDAVQIFDQMPERGLVSWNIIIAACTEHGKVKDAISYYTHMKSVVTPNITTYLNLIPVLNKKECFMHCFKLHSHVIELGLDYETAIGNALLNMYGRCGDLYNAELMFQKVLQRDSFTWNTMISLYVQHEQGKKATEVFDKMLMEGVSPDHITYVGLIDACALNYDLPAGLEIHKLVVGDGYELNIVVSTSLMKMYGKCKSLESAETVFKKLPERDLVSWNVMIEAYSQLNRHADALEVFNLMQIEGCIPDSITFVNLLSSCACKKASAAGLQIHKHLLLTGLQRNCVLNNALVSMYGRCGCLEEARDVFSQMQERNVVSWNVMITACTQNGEFEMALGVFELMKHSGEVPNQVSILAVLEACAGKGELTKGKELHNYINRVGFAFDTTIGSALIRMYSKCGNLKDAWNVFDRTPRKDLILWNTMIGCYAQHGLGEQALRVFEQMKIHGMKPDLSTFVSILSACNHTGLTSEGQMHFISMIQDYRLTPEVEHFNLLFDLLGRSGQINAVHDLIKYMPIEPSVASWVTLLSACKQHSLADLGTQITKEVLESEPKIAGAYVLCSNVLQYGRSGQINAVHDLIKYMPIEPSVASWVTLLSACKQHSLADLGTQITKEVLESEPKIAGAYVLCSNVLQYGRSGQINAVHDLIKYMPIEPSVASWVTLLSACKQHSLADLGTQITKEVLESEPKIAGAYVLCSNVLQYDVVFQIKNMAFSLCSEIKAPNNSDQNGGLVLVNGTKNAADPPDAPFFAVEFDTCISKAYGDVSACHVGIDVRSLVSLNVSDTSNATSPLHLYHNYTFVAWIQYDAAARFVQVWMTNVCGGNGIAFVRRPTQPCVTLRHDLSSVFSSPIYAGFSAADSGE